MDHFSLPASVEKSGRTGRRKRGETPGRELLLDAAMKQFSLYGYEQASLRAIATEAKVDTALVARLFGSKLSLWIAVVDQLAVKLEKNISRYTAIHSDVNLSPFTKMKLAIEHFIDSSNETPEYSIFLIHEAACDTERMDMIRDKLTIPLYKAISPIIIESIKHGIVNSSDPVIFFHMLTNGIAVLFSAHGLIKRLPSNSGKTLSEILKKEAIKTFLQKTEID